MLHYIQKNTQLSENSIQSTLNLLDQDCTIPFIARYRKEATGNLDEVALEKIVHFKTLFEALEKRKKAILKALEEQDVLTAELTQKNCGNNRSYSPRRSLPAV